MKHLKKIFQKSFGLVALLAAMFLVTPSFSNSSDCDRWLGVWTICGEDFDDLVNAIKEDCGGTLPAGVTITIVPC